MNLDRLYKILAETTVQLRKGEVVTGTPELVEEFNNLGPDDQLQGGGVLEIFAMPHESEARPNVEKVDLSFLTIGVDKIAAEKNRAELVGIMKSYPSQDRLQSGPSYIEVGAEIGDQGAAFQLFALGKVLGFWDVITPERLGLSGEQARQMAGAGYIMITGFHPDAAQVSA